MTTEQEGIRGKYKLELNFPGDGRCFLNFWDSIYGNDVVIEIINGVLEYTDHDVDGEFYREISFKEFIELVKQSISKQNK